MGRLFRKTSSRQRSRKVKGRKAEKIQTLCGGLTLCFSFLFNNSPLKPAPAVGDVSSVCVPPSAITRNPFSLCLFSFFFLFFFFFLILSFWLYHFSSFSLKIQNGQDLLFFLFFINFIDLFYCDRYCSNLVVGGRRFSSEMLNTALLYTGLWSVKCRGAVVSGRPAGNWQ